MSPPSSVSPPRYLFTVLTLMSAVWVGGAIASPSPTERTVRIAVRAHSGVDMAMAKWGPTADALTLAIPGRTFEVVPMVGFDEVRTAVKDSTVDFVLTNPTAFSELEIDCGVRRMATLRNLRVGAGASEFAGVVFTRTGTDEIRTLEDVRGHSIMGVHPEAFGGWWMALRELKDLGIDPFTDCSDVLFSPDGTQESVVRAVLDGRADIGTVRTGIIEGLVERGEIEAGSVTIVDRASDDLPYHHSTRHYPEWLFAALRQTSSELATQVAIVLMSMPKEDPAAVAGNYTGWSIPRDYGPVQTLMRELRVGPFAEPGRLPLLQAARQHWQAVLVALASILILALVAVYVATLNRRLSRARDDLVEHRENLEKQVGERTTELRAEKEKLESVFGAMTDGMYIVNRDYDIEYVNPVLVNEFGPPEGRKCYDYFHDRQDVCPWCKNPEVFNGETVRWEWTSLKNGRTYDLVDTLLTNADGSVSKLEIFRDVTDRKEAEEALRSSEEKFRSLYDNAPLSYQSLDEEGRFLDVNPAWLSTLGYDMDEVIGKNFGDFLHPDWGPHFEENFPRFKRDGSISDVQFKIRHKDGHHLDISFEGCIGYLPDGSFGQTYCVFQDITESKRAIDALVENEDRFRRLMENARDMIYRMSLPDGRYEYVSPAATEIFGYEPEVFIGSPLLIREAVHPDWRDFFEEQWEDLLKGELPPVYEYQIVHGETGEVRWIHQRNVLIRDAAGQPTAIEGIATDLTEFKRIQESTTIFGRVLESSLNEIFFFDAETLRFVEANRGALENLGYTLEELRERTPLDLKPEVTAETLADLVAPLRSGREQIVNFETVHRRKDGSLYPVDVFVQLMTEGSSVFVAAVLDITERKRAEEERERLARAIDQSTEAVVITDAQGMIQYTNPAFTRLSGYGQEEAVGKNPRVLKSGMHDEAFYKEMWETLASGETWTGRITNKRKDGSLFTEDATISPMRDMAGKTVNYVAVKRDVTAEIKLEEQLRQAQKMESVGRLAGGVAHDFNNMLGVILGRVDMAMGQVDPADPLHEDLQEIHKAAERSADLTRHLLAFARKQTIAPTVLDLNASIADMIKMLGRLIGEDIDLVWVPGEDVASVKMDVTQINQILANMCLNARDAIEGVGRITIETGSARFDDAYCADHPGSIPGDYALLVVSDDGCGMDKETQRKIYEPFFTTKELGQGTGLGLAMVYGVVKQNDGFIAMYSEPGRGTAFRIYLPRHEGASTPAPEKEKAIAPRKGDETILLVEDESAILELTMRMLQGLGYSVLEASTPAEGISLAREHDGRIHLLITDVVMPEMNGRELATELLSAQPGLRHLFMSGYTANVIAHHGVLDENVNFLQKPFSGEELAGKVREVLDAD